ncbi:unnamed protein product (macronuclear) [Paramecium tetraurelia]|uniref:C2 domain-containing protein n=1 Tax=Paramecium tetraurelia TaxID=5888 RepID=A0D7D1_PARTE|nr:uncharacterized protein GSPATT00001990001 [Paramecium tetraurelia]CAK78948.1 unnamed protein product [Paramecium tetraurelia]|eukprot:XP_001446345.1 hypothetical protein (macronuclear) [Paramecium tetraurelia strain d4-2]
MDDRKRKIVIKGANLTRSTKLFSKMNPFVKIITQKQQYRSSISKAAEKNPIWNDTELIEVDTGENIKLQILDFNSRVEPELIAETTLTSEELLGCVLKKDVFYQQQVVGQIELEIQKTIRQDANYVQNRVQEFINTVQQQSLAPQFQYP